MTLQWQLGAPFVLPGRERQSDEPFWERAEPTEVGGAATRRLSVADQLLHVVVDGIVASDGGSAQWCADAAFVLRAGAVDWDRFVALTAARRLGMVVEAALGYLVDALDVAVPAEVRARVSSLRVTRLDRRAFDRSLRAGPAGVRGLVDLGPDWAWRRAKLGPIDALRGVPTYVADAWQLPPHRVPLEAASPSGPATGRIAGS